MQTKKEILNILIEKIQSANEKLKMNFHQDEVKKEIDKNIKIIIINLIILLKKVKLNIKVIIKIFSLKVLNMVF